MLRMQNGTTTLEHWFKMLIYLQCWLNKSCSFGPIQLKTGKKPILM